MMDRLVVRLMFAFGAVAIVVAGVQACRPAPPSPAEVIVPADGPSLVMADIRVVEIELPRLICAVAQRGAQDPAISCVPKIPGMFDSGGR